MRLVTAILSLLALIGCGQGKPPEQKNNSADAGKGLRIMALTTPAEKLGFTSDNHFPNVYGVITDWNLGDQVASIVALKDGTASLYTTSTFGIIGGHGHENVRRAVERYIKTGEQYFNKGKRVNEFPYPEQGKIHFYLLTYDGVRLYVGDEANIDNNTNPGHFLFYEAQNVLTELRIASGL